MKKKATLLVLGMLLLAAVAVVAWKFLPIGRQSADDLVAMLPPVETGRGYLFWRVDSAEKARTQADEMFKISDALRGLPGLKPGNRYDGAADAPVAFLGGYFRSISKLVGMVDEMALLWVSPDASGSGETPPGLYMACYVDKRTFEEQFNENSGFFHDLKTTGGPGQTEKSAWVFSLGLGAEKTPTVYMTGEPRRGKQLLLLSFSEEGVREMASSSGRASGFAKQQTLADDDFLQIRLAAADGDEPTDFLIGGDDDKTRIRMRTSQTGVSKRAAAKSAGGAKGGFVPVGRGDVALYTSFTLAQVAEGALTEATDALFGLFEGQGVAIPGFVKNEILAVLQDGRISFCAVQQEREISGMYLVLEAPKDGALGRLYKLVGLAPSKSLAVPGWDEAFSVSIPTMSDVVLARRQGALLLGLGTGGNFAAKAGIPAGMETAFAERLPFDLFVAPSILQTTSRGLGGKIFDTVWAHKHKIHPELEKLDHMGIRAFRLYSDPERSETCADLFWKR